MSTPAQVAANQANSQHSTGPKSAEGKAAACKNNFHHGFCGAFTILKCEDAEEFFALEAGLHAEHKPATVTEFLFVEKMAQHHWLSQRAINLQNITMEDDISMRDKERQFALYLRYQTTNDRAFHRCLHDLLKLRAEKRRTEIGFESQKQKQADEARKEERHTWAILHAQGKADNQILQNMQFPESRERVEAGIRRIIALEKAA